MKHLLTPLYLLFTITGFAQTGLYLAGNANEKVLFYTGNESSLTIQGSFTNSNAANTVLVNGQINISDSLLNKSTGDLIDTRSTAKIVLDGTKNQIIAGSGNITLNTLELKKSAGLVKVENHLQITDSLLLTKGVLDMGTYIMSLGDTLTNKEKGWIKSERNENYLAAITGAVVIKRNNTTKNNFANLGLVLHPKAVYNTSYKVKRKQVAPLNAGDGGIKKLFEVVIEENVFLDSLSFSYLDIHDLNGINKDSLSLYLSYDNGGNWKKLDSKNYPSKSKVLGLGVQLRNGTNLLALSNFSCTKNKFAINLGPDTLDICKDQTIALSAGITAQEYAWSTGDSTYTINISKENSYKVEVINSRGCEAKDSVYLKQRPSPKADFVAPPPVCLNAPLTFENTSSISKGVLTSTWDFGTEDSLATSQETNPIIQFAQAKTYQVGLITTSDKNCKDTIVKSATILALPKSDFVINKICGDSAISIINTTTLADSNGGLTYFWDFGNNKTAVTQAIAPNPQSYYYVNPGVYQVVLKAVSNGGCEDVDTVSVTTTFASFGCGYSVDTLSEEEKRPACKLTNPSYEPQFLLASEIYEGDTVQFVNLTEPSPDKFIWLFGNGTFDTVYAAPKRNFFKPTTYTIKMISRYPTCNDTLEKKLTVLARPPRIDYNPQLIVPMVEQDSGAFVAFTDMRIYPVPVNETLQVEFVLDQEQEVSLKVFDLYGRQHLSQKVTLSKTTLDTRQLASGVYLLQATLGRQVKVLKFVKE